MYLFYVIMACTICVVLEARYRENVTIAFARTYFTFLQGTWFYQIGFILYPPGSMAHWDMEDHDQMMIITMIFSWYVIKARSAIRYCYPWLKLNNILIIPLGIAH